jgi:hypothetical protein
VSRRQGSSSRPRWGTCTADRPEQCPRLRKPVTQSETRSINNSKSEIKWKNCHHKQLNKPECTNYQVVTLAYTCTSAIGWRKFCTASEWGVRRERVDDARVRRKQTHAADWMRYEPAGGRKTAILIEKRVVSEWVLILSGLASWQHSLPELLERCSVSYRSAIKSQSALLSKYIHTIITGGWCTFFYRLIMREHDMTV